MKSLVDLLEVLLRDCGRLTGAAVARDVETLRARVADEGDGFMTITLPTFARDFERSLELGKVAPGAFLGFAKLRSGIPAFLQGFLCHVFDNEGCVRADVSVNCLRAVRQICLACKKVERPCSKERVLAATEAFVRCDDEVVNPSGPLFDMFRKVARILLLDLDLTKNSIMEDFVAKHGPGATREHIRGNSKWRFRRWHRRLDDVGLTHDICMWGQTRTADDSGVVVPDLVEPGCEHPVRVVFVPKTLKTPRVIAVEPVCMQFVQQGLQRVLVSRLERSDLTLGT